MTVIADVAAGTPPHASWGQAVTDAVNELQKLAVTMLTADESTNSSSPSDITGAGFAVKSGRVYVFRVVGQYSCSATNQGMGIGFRHPGGQAIGVFRLFGLTSAAVEAIERITTSSANTDIMTAAAVVNSDGTTYHFEATITYVCTADGTFQLRKQRNGTSGSTGLTVKAPMSVLAHQSAIS